MDASLAIGVGAGKINNNSVQVVIIYFAAIIQKFSAAIIQKFSSLLNKWMIPLLPSITIKQLTVMWGKPTISPHFNINMHLYSDF